MFLYGPAGLPLAISDDSDVTSSLIDITGVSLLPVSNYLSADVISLTALPTGSHYDYYIISTYIMGQKNVPLYF